MKSNRGRREKSKLDIEITKEIGIQIKKARTLKKISQIQLSKLMGVSIDSVRNWEQGKFKPAHEDNYTKLREILDVDVRPSNIESKKLENLQGMIGAIRDHYEEREYLPLLLERMGHDLSDHKLKFRKFEEYLLGSINHAIKNSDLPFEDFMAEQVKSSIELYNILHSNKRKDDEE